VAQIQILKLYKTIERILRCIIQHVMRQIQVFQRD
jgi:hypothetical protein